MAEDPFGLVGQTIEGRYRVDELVGEGGFGVVYRGQHLALKQPVAIKCLKVPGHFTTDARNLFFDKFRGEGEHLAKLSEHRSVVRVYDLGTVATQAGPAVPYLVLEWLEGVDLEEHLAARTTEGQTPPSEQQAAAFLRPVVEAIAFAHRLGIAHRDLKPANVFVADTPLGKVPKVVDFGIAKAMQEGETATVLATHTSSGFAAFSPQYGAPEQYSRKRFGPTGPWTDVHALGLILVELVSGRPPYDGDEHTDFLLAATDPARPTPRARGVQVTDAFEQLCARALALMPSERFQDGEQIREALAALDKQDEAPAASNPLLKPTPARAEPSPAPLPRTELGAPEIHGRPAPTVGAEPEKAPLSPALSDTVPAPPEQGPGPTVSAEPAKAPLSPAPMGTVLAQPHLAQASSAAASPLSSRRLWLAGGMAALAVAAVAALLLVGNGDGDGDETGPEEPAATASAEPAAPTPVSPSVVEAGQTGTEAPAPPSGCPADMVEVAEEFCIDRYEVSLVDRDSGESLSPYYSPSRTIALAHIRRHKQQRRDAGTEMARSMPLPELPPWPSERDPVPKAVSRRGAVPQAMITGKQAQASCLNAEKRLCTVAEWRTACRGAANAEFPYGTEFMADKCNIHSRVHPADLLFGSAARGHTDPRLNTLSHDGKPLLWRTGSTESCRSQWGADGVYDMIGNLQEWVKDDAGLSVAGGYYTKATRKGCELVTSLPPTFANYTTGARCCADLGSVKAAEP